ncbi:MAG: FAD:protein FMN transferase [Steroidobacteraceae bacterium]|jgi:thiamine biosynthesis lipoprotein|nr:FAD:protein FMN transferase [Steroidobacteraceae bacterium]
MSGRRGGVLRAWLLLAALLPALAHAEWFRREAAVMGTRIYVELWAEEAAAGEAAIAEVIESMRAVDEMMSTYKPESQLSRVNARGALEAVPVDAELFDVIRASLEFSRLTGGAFDVTYASVGYLYDYRARQRPTDAQISKALPGVNWRNVRLDPAATTVRFDRPGMRIDLGGIAKGYAVDRAIRLLQARGVAHAVVSAGGDSRIIGDRFGRPWIVGIRHPDDPKRVVTRIPLVDTAMSTSGDYERYFDEDGVRYHHILDPKTGRSASKVRSATILASTAMQTDGLSKTAFVLGAEEALKIIERIPGVDAVFVTPEGKVLYTKGLQPAQ